MQEGGRHEVIDGQRYVTPDGYDRDWTVNGQLSQAFFDHWNAGHHDGDAIPDGRLFFDERNDVRPDIVFVHERYADRVTNDYVRGPVDLVVEVASDATRQRDRTIKRDLYGRTGVVEYWLVDPGDETVLVHRRDPGFDQPSTLRPGDVLTSALLPGLAIPVADVFA
jgi:Uma2 family endonuclease